MGSLRSHNEIVRILGATYTSLLAAFEGACVGGWGWRGHRPSVVIGGSSVLDPAAERAPLNRCSPTPTASRRPSHITIIVLPSVPTQDLPLPPPALSDCLIPPGGRRLPAQAPLPPPPPRCFTAPSPPLPMLTPPPPYCCRCHRRHASPTLPSCHCCCKAVAAEQLVHFLVPKITWKNQM
jgi:hypothetical protein